MDRRSRRPSVVGPVLLIGAGIVLLLNSLGTLSWSVWETLLRLWPIILVAIGLDLLIGRRSLLGSLLVAVIVLAVLGASVWWFASQPGAGMPLESEQISQPLGDAARAEVTLTFGAGELQLGALAEGPNLIEGTVSVVRGGQVRRDFSVSGGTAYLTLVEQDGPGWVWAGQSGWQRVWALRLTPNVPLTLRVNTGAGSANLDLTQLKVTDLRLATGVGETVVTLPRTGRVQGNLSGGIGQTTVIIPAGMAARIVADSGLGRVVVPDGYQRQGNVYVSPGYDTADNRADLSVHGGIGQIVIQAGTGQ